MQNKFQYIPSIFKVNSIEFDEPKIRDLYKDVVENSLYAGIDIRTKEGEHVCALMASGEGEGGNFLFFRDKNKISLGIEYDILTVPLDEVELHSDILESVDFELLSKLSDKTYLQNLRDYFFQTECVNILGAKASTVRALMDSTEHMSSTIEDIKSNKEEDIDESEYIEDSDDGMDFEDELEEYETIDKSEILDMLNGIADKKPILFSSIATMIIEIARGN